MLVEAAEPGELQPIEGSLFTWAELRWAAREEGVVHLDDLLLRRLRLGLTLPEGGLAHLDRIRTIAQPELGWDDERWTQEIERYRELWRTGYSPSAS
jgi:glycerol-3-phosphate dehydrogenase